MRSESKPLPPITYIDTTAKLCAFIARAEAYPLLGVDTESDSMHRYREKMCLIQLSIPGEDALVDVLAVDDVQLLSELFDNPRCTKIFHDACFDLVCLRRDFQLEVRNIFDTMLACRLLGWRKFGLAHVLEEHFGVKANKALQRSDWTQRPLSAAQLEYARRDSHYLIPLVDTLRQGLQEMGRLDWALQEFRRLPTIAGKIPTRVRSSDDPDAFWRVKGIKALPPDVRGRVRALFYWRERLAERWDRPPFKVMGDKVLISIALDNPRSVEALERPGLRHSGAQRFGRDIFNALAKARPVRSQPPASQKKSRSGRFLDPDTKARYEALRKFRIQQAERLDLDADVLLSNATLEWLAKKHPKTQQGLNKVEELQGWRNAVLGESLLKHLTTKPRSA